VDTTAAPPRRDFATFAPILITKEEVINTMEYQHKCLPERSHLQCMVWHGDLELRGRIALRNRHGLSFVLVFNDIPQQPQHPPQTSSEIWPEESDDESLLQLRGSPSTAAHSTQNGGLDC
jgi:hypothetical protein